MRILKVPGAQLSYDVSGSGPLLILIPGASGTGESFRPLERQLIPHYQVVTYDRRGLSRSTLDGPQDYTNRLTTDADDVRRLIEHVTDQPAIVFGSSSGAIVALEVLSRFPEHVQLMVHCFYFPYEHWMQERTPDRPLLLKKRLFRADRTGKRSWLFHSCASV